VLREGDAARVTRGDDGARGNGSSIGAVLRDSIGEELPLLRHDEGRARGDCGIVCREIRVVPRERCVVRSVAKTGTAEPAVEWRW
jgi:hypothetical protein